MNVNHSIADLTAPWLDLSSQCWPLDDHHFAEVVAVCASMNTDGPPLWSASLSPAARAARAATLR